MGGVVSKRPRQAKSVGGRKNGMTVASFKLPLSLSSSLEEIAHDRGTTKSEVVREALERYVTLGKRVSPGSFLERAKKYIGCVEGPGDLSFNEEHMEGFGE